jgi:hypothetical protein
MSSLHKTLRRGVGAVILALAGCGTTGVTTPTEHRPPTLAPTVKVRPTSLGSIDRDETGIRLMSVGVFPWGKFDNTDQANIESSIKSALISAQQASSVAADSPAYVHVLIRKYFVGASNNEGAILAGIDWVISSEDKSLLYHDAFYVTHTCKFPRICTLGSEKTEVNKAIVERVVRRALSIGAGGNPNAEVVEHAYDSFGEAAATMPEVLRSWGSAFLVGSSVVLTPGTKPRDVPLDWAEMQQPVDWSARLSPSHH